MPVTGLTARELLRRFTLGSGPLKRGSDRLQCLARVLLVLLLLTAVPVALAVATASYTQALADAAAQAESRHRTSAVLLEDPSFRSGAADVYVVPRARVTWPTPTGGTRDGVIGVPEDAVAGSSVTVWVDRDGDLTGRPRTERDATGAAVASGALTFLCVSAVVILLYEGLRWLLDRSRMRRWETKWAVVEPIWTGKVP